jgi:urocanate hydratase
MSGRINIVEALEEAQEAIALALDEIAAYQVRIGELEAEVAHLRSQIDFGAIAAHFVELKKIGAGSDASA